MNTKGFHLASNVFYIIEIFVHAYGFIACGVTCNGWLYLDLKYYGNTQEIEEYSINGVPLCDISSMISILMTFKKIC